METNWRRFGLLRTLRQLGWRNAALYWLARLLVRASAGRWRLHRYYFVAQHVGELRLAGARGADIAIRPHQANAAAPDGYPRSPQVVAARLQQGARSLQAWRGGRLAGFLWLIDGAYREDEVRVCYELASPQSCWDFDVWIAPDQRGGLAFARLWDAARVHLRERGIAWTCSRISAFNAASLHAHAALGLVRIGSAVFLCCGSWQWMISSVAPRFHWSRTVSSSAHLRFDTGTLAIPTKEHR